MKRGKGKKFLEMKELIRGILNLGNQGHRGNLQIPKRIKPWKMVA